MLEEFFSWLNRIFAEYFLGGFEGMVEYGDEKIYLFSENSAMAGFSTYWGDILLNEILFHEGNGDILNIFYLHEDFHRRHRLDTFLGGLTQGFLSPQAIVIHFAASMFLLISLAISISWLSSQTALRILIIQFSAVLVASTISTLSELRAKLSVVGELGTEDYLNIREEAREKFPNPGFLTRIYLFLTHPKAEAVVKVYSLLNRENPVFS